MAKLPKPFSTPRRSGSKTFQLTLKHTRDMFAHGAAHIKRWMEKGYVLKPQTIARHRRHLTGYILPRFGKFRFTEITPTAVEDFLSFLPIH